MSSRFLPPRCLAVLLAALTPAFPAVAQLASRSPFLPAAGEVAPEVPAPILEFRGYVADTDGIRFRVTDTSRNAGAWVRLNERNADLNLVATQYDAARASLLVEFGGRAQLLTQRTSKIASIGLAAPAVTPFAARSPVPSAPPPLAVSGNTALEQQRALESLAATLAARRAARAQPAPAAR